MRHEELAHGSDLGSHLGLTFRLFFSAKSYTAESFFKSLSFSASITSKQSFPRFEMWRLSHQMCRIGTAAHQRQHVQ